MDLQSISGNIVDVVRGEIYPATVFFDGLIRKIVREKTPYRRFILPGLIDAHIHIESSMLSPSGFARAVVPHGTTSVVTDPHEIANVAGIEGIKYMMADSPEFLNVFFTAPSCVPLDPFERSGAVIGPAEIRKLLSMDKVVALGEVMCSGELLDENYGIMEKISIARKMGRKVDGHAPGLRGRALDDYVSAGIETDHECTTLPEAVEKIRKGMKIMVREGSTEKNMEELIELISRYPDSCFLVTDDANVGDLMKGHVNSLLKKAVSLGADPMDAVRCCTLNPSHHYGLGRGTLEKGSPADIAVIKDIRSFEVKAVYSGGKLSAVRGSCVFYPEPKMFGMNIRKYPIEENDFTVRSEECKAKVRAIGIIEDQILTTCEEVELRSEGMILPDRKKDTCYVSVVDRYIRKRPYTAFVKGLYVEGGIASSIAHDSHNIIVVGDNPKDMLRAGREVMKNGGLSFFRGKESAVLKLPVAGLMSRSEPQKVAEGLERIQNYAKGSGCSRKQPFMHMSFLSLLALPELRISSRGLFDSLSMKFVEAVK